MIKLNEEFQTKPATIVKNLKRHMENWPEEDSKILESVVASIVAGTTIFDVEKETIKESLQNYILTKLKNGVNDISLFFIFDLEEFDSFSYFDFVETFDESDVELVNKEVKSYFEELLGFDQKSYTLTTKVEAINDPMDYGELIKVTATITI